MIDKREYTSKLKFYCIVVLIAFIPIVAVNFLLYGKVTEVASWFINGALLIIALFIGFLIERKMAEKKSKIKNKKDPFAD